MNISLTITKIAAMASTPCHENNKSSIFLHNTHSEKKCGGEKMEERSGSSAAPWPAPGTVRKVKSKSNNLSSSISNGPSSSSSSVINAQRKVAAVKASLTPSPTHLDESLDITDSEMLVPSNSSAARNSRRINSTDRKPAGNSSDAVASQGSGSAGSAPRLKRFLDALSASNIDLEHLRKISWSGIPEEVRPTTWKLLLGYLPTNSDRRSSTLERKRKEYRDGLEQYFNVGEQGRDEYEEGLFRQIHIDVPRTNPTCPLFQQETVQRILERILYMWAIRHPASGYVQGINDLATPFFVVFLSEIYKEGDIENCRVDELSKEELENVEADCFWCMSQLLDCIQENYTFAQPGIQRMIFKLQELVDRIDAPLAHHLEKEDASFLQFSFRWMNCLLMREIPLRLIVRIWDTYLAEGESFATYHVYVCAAFLIQWSERIRSLPFQEMMIYLQHLPTSKWDEKDVEMLLSQAYLYQSLYHNSPSHLKQPG